MNILRRETNMKTYTCDNFIGHYPVGTAAVIVAEDEVMADLYLRAALKEEGLEQPADKVLVFKKVNTGKPFVDILCNGNY